MGSVLSSAYILYEGAVLILVGQLGHPSYRVREQASAALVPLAPVALRQLEAAEGSRDAEVATRARKVVDRWYRLTAPARADRVRPTRSAVLPWIEHMPRDGETRDYEIRYYLLQVGGLSAENEPPDWPRSRAATRLLVIDLLARRVPEEEVVRILDRMVDTDRRWVEIHGRSFSPPLQVTGTSGR